jgi:hypothetical protein
MDLTNEDDALDFSLAFMPLLYRLLTSLMIVSLCVLIDITASASTFLVGRSAHFLFLWSSYVSAGYTGRKWKEIDPLRRGIDAHNEHCDLPYWAS